MQILQSRIFLESNNRTSILDRLLERSVSAQSPNNCRKVKGTVFEVFGSGNVNIGTLRHAGILNGRAQRVFNSASLPTPDPEAVSFTSDYEVTTRKGVLTTHVVYIVDFVRAPGAAIHRIDPDASTGIFEGATGVLFENDKLDFQSFSVESVPNPTSVGTL